MDTPNSTTTPADDVNDTTVVITPPSAAAAPPELPPTPPVNHTPEPPRPLSLSFTGTGSEYFRIWIVNLGLSLLTLGIYSAWAKVRTARWFYGHTWLDGQSFNYLARPIQILKSRLIALALLLVYVLAGQFAPVLAAVLALTIMLLTPWILVASLRFRARMSAYRGLRFNFVGQTGDAFVLYLLLPLALPFTLGLLLPYYLCRRVRFIANNVMYGQTRSTYQGTSSHFWPLFWMMLGGLFFVIIIGVLATLVVATLPPLAIVAIPVVQILVFLVILIGSIAVSTFIQNNLFNYTQLGPIHFEGRLRVKGLAWIGLSNLVLMVLTLGLYYPWAKVRMTRYYTENIGVQTTGDLNQFVADQNASASAFGSEFADVFDIGAAL